jgi:hypothetical protein
MYILFKLKQRLPDDCSANQCVFFNGLDIALTFFLSRKLAPKSSPRITNSLRKKYSLISELMSFESSDDRFTPSHERTISESSVEANALKHLLA